MVTPGIRRRFSASLAVCLLLAFTVASPSRAAVAIRQVFSAPGSLDQDDMCIWVHPADPALSTVITSDKPLESGTVIFEEDGSEFTLTRSSGGLVSGIGPIHESQDSLWIGNPFRYKPFYAIRDIILNGQPGLLETCFPEFLSIASRCPEIHL